MLIHFLKTIFKSTLLHEFETKAAVGRAFTRLKLTFGEEKKISMGYEITKQGNYTNNDLKIMTIADNEEKILTLYGLGKGYIGKYQSDNWKEGEEMERQATREAEY